MTTSSTAVPPITLSAPSGSLGPARFMFGFDALTAGALGLGLLVAPAQVGEMLFAAQQDPAAARLVGAVFVGFAVVSVAGVRQPDRYLPLFLVQSAYKTLWLATTLPAAAERPALAGMAASFGLYLAGYAVALRAARWPSVPFGRSRR